jgi:membrane-associated phospholipid phosphatase
MLAAPVAHAEQTAAWAPSQRGTANTLSNVTLGAQIGLDTWHSLKSSNRVNAFCEQGLGLAIAIGVDTLLKHSIKRLRPDGSTFDSFPSGHTGAAAASGGWNFSFSAPLTEFVAVTRWGANRHYPTDTAVGAAIGTVARIGAKGWCWQ